MSFTVKCDVCGKEAPSANGGNPVNPDTGKQWWSRSKEVEGKRCTQHACSETCRDQLGGMYWPEFAR